MGRVLGNPYGEIRGKVGGSVFSRNKGGAIMRVYAKPTNTNSIGQRIQRNSFRSMSGAWSTLTDVQRQQWESFAKSSFNPLLKTNSGNQSGVNAMKASKLVMSGLFQRFVASVWGTDANPAPLAHTVTTGSFNPDAPVLSVRPTIKSGTGTPVGLDLDNLVIQASGPVSFDVNLIGVPALGLSQGDLIDESDIPISFALYLSDSVKQFGSKPKSAFNFCIGQTGFITFTSDDLALAKVITVTWDAINLIPNYVAFPQVGAYCLVTLVVVGDNGTQSIASQKYVAITA